MNGNPQSTFSAFHGKAICKLRSKFEMNFSCTLERYFIKTISANVDQGTFVRNKFPGSMLCFKPSFFTFEFQILDMTRVSNIVSLFSGIVATVYQND